MADTTIPIISLIGSSTVNTALGATYTDAGATATDNVDGNITASIQTTSTVNTNAIGSYTVKYNVSDAAGNAATEVTRTVNVTDQTIPVISLVGSSTVTVAHGSTYSDSGATATDNLDGSLTSSIQTTSNVNTSAVGSYTVSYNVSDAAGNAATEVTRTVNVTDQAIPTISRIGSSTVTVAHASTYTDAGATATDVVDGNLTSSIQTTSTVNTNAVGSYTVSYNVSDAAGNAATEVTRTVNVTDQAIPVISLVGSSTVTTALSGTYTDAGATATDAVDGNLTSSIQTTSNVNTSTVGSYTVSYNVSDAAGNAATEVTRTVNVADQTIPVISLVGSSTVTVAHGSTYSDSGATATDNLDGNLTGSIQTTSTVNTSAVGTYTVKYNVSDAAGNAATEVTRTVNVTDQAIPTISLVGSSTVTVAHASTYTDAGATATDAVDGNITSSIQTTSNVNTSAVGSYSVTYNVSDAAGNAATEVTRTVNVTDQAIPVISLVGSSTVTVTAGTTYTDAGATATDAADGNLTSSIQTTSTVNTNVTSTYTVKYNVSDAAGNAATEVTRIVNVLPTISENIFELESISSDASDTSVTGTTDVEKRAFTKNIVSTLTTSLTSGQTLKIKAGTVFPGFESIVPDTEDIEVIDTSISTSFTKDETANKYIYYVISDNVNITFKSAHNETVVYRKTGSTTYTCTTPEATTNHNAGDDYTYDGLTVYFGSLMSNLNPNPTPVDILFSNHISETFASISTTIPGFTTTVSTDATVTCTGPAATVFQNTFYFKTDSDIATNATDDVKYYVDTSQWSTMTTDLNASTNGTVSVADGGFVAGESISESFLRHLADKLFGTHLGVDLFNNETTVKADIISSCGTLATNIGNTISSVGISGSDTGSLLGSVGSYYLDDNVTAVKNITRELVNQLLNNAGSKSRFNANNLSSYAVSGQTGVYKVPLIAGDSVSYAVTITPHANQDTNVPTGTASTSRKFLVKIILQ